MQACMTRGLGSSPYLSWHQRQAHSSPVHPGIAHSSMCMTCPQTTPANCCSTASKSRFIQVISDALRIGYETTVVGNDARCSPDAIQRALSDTCMTSILVVQNRKCRRHESVPLSSMRGCACVMRQVIQIPGNSRRGACQKWQSYCIFATGPCGASR